MEKTVQQSELKFKKRGLGKNTTDYLSDDIYKYYCEKYGNKYKKSKCRSFVNIYLNDEDVRFLDDKYHTELKGGDILSIIPSIAGGSP